MQFAQVRLVTIIARKIIWGGGGGGGGGTLNLCINQKSRGQSPPCPLMNAMQRREDSS